MIKFISQINKELERNVQTEAENQRRNILKGNPPLKLVAPCRIDEGILKRNEFDRKRLISLLDKSSESIGFFIPASGSGSRMFQFLYAYLNEPNDENSAMAEHFFNSMDKMAFYKILPADVLQKLETGQYDIAEIANYILNEKGLNLGNSPKGLIPFHKMGQFVLNPFQDQILQGEVLHKNVSNFHFSIQKDFEMDIKASIDNLRKFTGAGKKIDYSHQSAETNAFAFDEHLNLVENEMGDVLRRPAGHGALLENLMEMETDVVLIKNIDNIQHWERKANGQENWKVIIGLLLEIKIEIKNLIENFDLDRFHQFNSTYQIFHPSVVQNYSDLEILAQLARPIRVCGMVRNIGQPGGGPYWVEENKVISKQIVEKSQIAHDTMQQSLLVKSTHFNPVMMAISTKNKEGEKFDFKQYVDKEKYFVVEKEFQGKKIKFCELPGLWNGSMSNWNTVFVEVPNAVFSPVKTVLDLLNPAHQSIHDGE